MLPQNLFCSWQSGVVSCLSLYQTLQAHKVSCLVSAMVGPHGYNGLYQLSHRILRIQADRLKIPLLIFNSSVQDYEETYRGILNHFRKKHALDGGVFSCVSHDAEKSFFEDFCRRVHLKSYYPLWQKRSSDLAFEFLKLGFKAKVIAIHGKKLPREMLGKEFNQDFISELSERQIDPLAESGEFFTFVYDGPLFSEPLELKFDDLVYDDQHWRLSLL